ncbi:MAG: EutN/CcmL family microcompartment protein [Verrucomicrobia bacterium]|nr:EutN/CcmL family microcompartment protein [Verrucomicrobiota bacterium]MCF7707331.1 EutN/CcmL family microcompartment protein [Verrucomicrobiota bacterium]
MLLARVEGNLTSTRKHPSLDGWRLIVCQPLDHTRQPKGAPVVAIDRLGAAMHHEVIVSSDGAAARHAVNDPKSPVRMMIVAIVDNASERTEVAAV